VITAIDEHNATDPHLPVEASCGFATAGSFGSIASAFEAADRGLYGVKGGS
jgi:hypothetical protein